MIVRFYEDIADTKLKFAVICALYQDKLIFVQHKERTSLEIPGGHREEGETIEACARRELWEETGAISFLLEKVCIYSVEEKNNVNACGNESFGALYIAHVDEIGVLPESEIKEVFYLDKEPLQYTYPMIQPMLLKEIKKRGYIKNILFNDGE